MTDIERIRALCETFIDEAQHQVDEVGEVGAHEAMARAKVCRQIIDEIALLPAAGDARRIPPAVRAELEDYASVGAAPSTVLRWILEGDLFGAFWWSTDKDNGAVMALPAIVAFIREAMHPTIYGSPEAVSRWISRPRS